MKKILEKITIESKNQFKPKINNMNTIKIVAILLISIFSSSKVNSQIISIPDSNFEQALINLGHDNILDGQVDYDNIKSIRRLDISNKSISSLEGIKYFTALNELYAGQNTITEIDFNGLINLEYIIMNNNNINRVDLSALRQMRKISFARNNLEFLNITNLKLVFINVEDNNLTEILGLEMTLMRDFFVSNNNLSEIDLTAAVELYQFHITENDFTKIDLSNAVKVAHVYANNNHLTYINIKNGNNDGVLASVWLHGNIDLACLILDSIETNNRSYHVNMSSNVIRTTDINCGIELISISQNLKIYPNPFTNYIKILSEELVPFNFDDIRVIRRVNDPIIIKYFELYTINGVLVQEGNVYNNSIYINRNLSASGRMTLLLKDSFNRKTTHTVYRKTRNPQNYFHDWR